jgi:hypothetical protein
VTDLRRPISDRRLRLFYYIKLYFKSEPSDLYLMAKIQNHVKLRAKSTVENPDPVKYMYPLIDKPSQLIGTSDHHDDGNMAHHDSSLFFLILCN